jgi:HK97 family phage major capsid protein
MLKKLQERLIKIGASMKTMNDGLIQADGTVRSFTEDEQKEWDKLKAESDEVKAAIERQKEIEANEQRARELGSVAEPTQIQVTREHNHNEKGEYRGFATLGEQLRAVVMEETPTLRKDPRLAELQRSLQARLEKRAPSGANTLVGSEGGFMLQTDFSQEIMDKSIEGATLASRCSVFELSEGANEVEITMLDETSRKNGYRFGGLRSHWRAEGETVASSFPKLRQERCRAEGLDVIAYVTDEQSRSLAYLNKLAELAPKEIGFVIDDAIYAGDGAGKPLGVLNSPALITVSAEGGQAADTVKYANISKMKARLFAGSRPKFEVFAHLDVEAQLEQMVLAGASSDVPVWLPAGGAADRPYDRLFGRPLNYIEQAKALGDVGDILFADFSQYALVRKGGVEAAESIHVRFLYHEKTFRFSVAVNGFSMWDSALTDYNGSQTRSPFVTLAAR